MDAPEIWWLFAAVFAALAAVVGFIDYRPPHGTRASFALTSLAIALVAAGFIAAYP